MKGPKPSRSRTNQQKNQFIRFNQRIITPKPQPSTPTKSATSQDPETRIKLWHRLSDTLLSSQESDTHPTPNQPGQTQGATLQTYPPPPKESNSRTALWASEPTRLVPAVPALRSL